MNIFAKRNLIFVVVVLLFGSVVAAQSSGKVKDWFERNPKGSGSEVVYIDYDKVVVNSGGSLFLLGSGEYFTYKNRPNVRCLVGVSFYRGETNVARSHDWGSCAANARTVRDPESGSVMVSRK